MGHSADLCSSGDEAMDLLHASCYDLVITDLNMPKMSGIELIERIRNSGKPCSTMPILCITADDGSLKPEAIEAGATGWVEKPFDSKIWGLSLSKLLEG